MAGSPRIATGVPVARRVGSELVDERRGGQVDVVEFVELELLVFGAQAHVVGDTAFEHDVFPFQSSGDL